jgi:hypothetical protein
MILNNWDIKKHLEMSSDYRFECNVNIFDKAIVMCQPKVGSRFFLFLSNWPKNINETYNQYQINLSYGNESDNRLKLNNLFTNFKTSISFIEDHKNSCYDYDTFFSKNNINNMNEFFLENPKDMYFVIRNPIKRFLSGISQVASAYVSECITQIDERERIKRLGNLTDLEIDNVYNNYNDYFNEFTQFSEDSLAKIDVQIFVKIVLYIINHAPHLYQYDNHTDNYLFKYKELIYNVSDKTKVKIIDLEDCTKKSAYDLFNTWSDDIDYSNAYYNTNGHTVSNVKLYNHIDFILKGETPQSQVIYNFLSNEIKEYNELKNSKYFVKL